MQNLIKRKRELLTQLLKISAVEQEERETCAIVYAKWKLIVQLSVNENY